MADIMSRDMAELISKTAVGDNGRRVYVLAANYQHAEYWRRENHFLGRQVVFLSDPRRADGCRDVKVHFYPTWLDHPKALEIARTLDMCGYTALTTAEVREWLDGE